MIPAEVKSRTGHVLVIYTHLGEITVDGETVFFHDSIQGAFSRAGLSVDPTSGRRLLGVVEILGFFNKVNKLLAEMNQTAESNLPSPMPLTFTANLMQIQKCMANDCNVDGVLVDWATATADGEASLVTQQELYSLMLNSKPVAKTVLSKQQWPNQSMTVLQNSTHRMIFQTYGGLNYYCSLTNDTSLQAEFQRRRRRLRALEQGTAPFEFKGFVTVNGVYCKHFRLVNTSFDIYEDYFNKQVYQIVTSALTWRFESLSAVTSQTWSSLVSAADFDLDGLLKACDPPGRVRPTHLRKDEYVTNAIVPQPSWGMLKMDSNSSLSFVATSADFDFSNFESSN